MTSRPISPESCRRVTQNDTALRGDAAAHWVPDPMADGLNSSKFPGIYEWDNRRTMHRGTEYDERRWKRDMHRATVSDIGNTCEA